MKSFALSRVLACILSGLISFSAAAAEEGYPPEWWAYVDPSTAPTWEILPQEAGPGEVILSKRTELGVFSNFAATSFKFEDVVYASVEGFWQMMKFPDALLQDDPRLSPDFTWSHTREEVGNLVGFEAKDAGNEASKVMKALEINWVSYKGKQMVYRTSEKGEHYDLIRRAMREKMEQNPQVKELLLKTGNLILKPDHDQGSDVPPAWEYFKIWMEFRDELNASTCQN